MQCVDVDGNACVYYTLIMSMSHQVRAYVCVVWNLRPRLEGNTFRVCVNALIIIHHYICLSVHQFDISAQITSSLPSALPRTEANACKPRGICEHHDIIHEYIACTTSRPFFMTHRRWCGNITYLRTYQTKSQTQQHRS